MAGEFVGRTYADYLKEWDRRFADAQEGVVVVRLGDDKTMVRTSMRVNRLSEAEFADLRGQAIRNAISYGERQAHPMDDADVRAFAEMLMLTAFMLVPGGDGWCLE